MEWLKALFLSVIAVFAPVHAVMFTVGFLIFADLITGIIAAHKRGEKITSAGVRRTISKMVVFQLAIMSAFLIETYISVGVPITKLAAATIALTELLSVMENVESVYGSPIFKSIIKKIGSDNDKKEK